MARSPGIAGDNLLGLPRAANRPPNTNSLGRSLVILLVLVLGALYAAPNLFQPDPALQIRATGESEVDPSALERAVDALERAGIEVRGFERDGASGLIRVTNDDAQLRGRDIVSASLNPTADRRYVVALNRASNTPDWLRDIGGKPMSLGLDLSGGVHFLLQVDMDKFLGDRMEINQEAIRDLLVRERIRYVGRDWLDGASLNIGFQTEQGRDQAQGLISEEFDDFEIAPREVDGQPGLRLSISEQKMTELEDFAISQNLTSLRNRVNELGVSEPLVQRLGRSRIVLDLPGVQDSARAKEIINKFANLEFRMVAGSAARPSQTETHQYEGAPVVLEKANIVTGNQVTNAVQDFDPESGQPQVSITLDNEGGRRMNDVTKDNVGNRMAIIFKELKVRSRTVRENGESKVVPYTVEEKRVINVATVQSALGFRFRITGLELGEARDLALLLRAGALAAPMYIVEERTVGASLGEENIEQGRTSVIIGFVLVLIFMLAYYKWFGLAANVALTANLVLIVAVMSVLGATLTLPGIAGIVLTVGMAVDANVLIFARIREELKQSSPQMAIQAGFDRAIVTILDANITTFFVAIILFSIGSGPVKGFAVTLAVGIVTSMFTAIMVTRALVNLMYGGRKLEEAGDMTMSFTDLNIDFMSKRRIAGGISIVLVVLALVQLLVQGLNQGLDFTGGTLVEVKFPVATEPARVRRQLEDAGFSNGVVQYFGSDRDLLVRMPPQAGTEQAEMGDQIFGVLKDLDSEVVLLQSNYVGPAVGEELRHDAGLALLAALGAVMLYILFRFTKQFAVGAVVALAHDVIVVMGCFSLFQWTFDLPVLAAVLAVIGYSLNDTIVVSDRIRENFRSIRRASPVEVINRSLNQTLGRTLVTSLTTLLVLVALLLAGGELIKGFATALTIGVVVGTYSSVYVAANVLLLMNISRDDLLVPEKEGETDPERP